MEKKKTDALADLDKTEAVRTAVNWFGIDSIRNQNVDPNIFIPENVISKKDDFDTLFANVEAMREKLGNDVANQGENLDSLANALLDVLILDKRAGKEKKKMAEDERANWIKLYDGLAKGVKKQLTEETKRQRHRAWMESERFPDFSQIQPTWLGNMGVRLNDYTENRYGMPLTILWPRLGVLLDEEIKRDISKHRLNVETIVNLSVTSALLAISLTALNLYEAWGAWRNQVQQEFDFGFSLIMLLLVVFSLLFYRVAVFAFGKLSKSWLSIVDLYCYKLPMHFFKQPESISEVKEVLSGLRVFYQHADEGITKRPLKNELD